MSLARYDVSIWNEGSGPQVLHTAFTSDAVCIPMVLVDFGIRWNRGFLIKPLLRIKHFLAQLWNRGFLIKPLLRIKHFLAQLWNRGFLIKPLLRIKHFLAQPWNRGFLIKPL